VFRVRGVQGAPGQRSLGPAAASVVSRRASACSESAIIWGQPAALRRRWLNLWVAEDCCDSLACGQWHPPLWPALFLRKPELDDVQSELRFKRDLERVERDDDACQSEPSVSRGPLAGRNLRAGVYGWRELLTVSTSSWSAVAEM